MEQHEPAHRPLLTFDADSSFAPMGKPMHQGPGRLLHEKAQRSPKTPWSGVSRIFSYGWTAEVATCVFALLALAGLAVVLSRFEDRPLPDWPKLITVNSIISIFALLIRASVGLVLAEGISQSKWQWFRKPRQLADMERYDAASRSAWGSFLLVCRATNKRVSWIVVFGSIITIMGALLGFFTQQLVQFQDCLRKDEAAVVSVSRTSTYVAQGPYTGPIEADVFPPMVAAINNAILQPTGDHSKELASCFTGNCTFPATDGVSFSTLAISHFCEDATSQLVVSDYFPPDTNWTDTTMRSVSLNATGSTSNATPGNASLILGFRFPALSTWSIGAENGTLATVKMVYQKETMNLDVKKVSALSCSIYPVVKSYGVNMTNGNLTETLLDVTRISDTFPSAWFAFTLATNHTLRNNTRVSCDRQRNDAPGYIRIDQVDDDGAAERKVPTNPFGDFPKGPDVWYYPDDCVWSFGEQSTQGIEAYFTEIFNQPTMFWGNRIGGNTGSIYLRRIYQGGNMTLATVDDVFRNITDAMSVVVRTNGYENSSEPLRGTMWYRTTCMQIQWEWIAFPAALIGLSVVFLVLVGIESRNVESDRLWKSSVLATLFCNVEQVDVHGMQPTGNGAMIEIAHSTSVSLDSNRQELRLVSR